MGSRRSNPAQDHLRLVRVRLHPVRIRKLPARAHWGPLRLDRLQVRPVLARIQGLRAPGLPAQLRLAPGHPARDPQVRQVRRAHGRRDLQDRLVHVHQARFMSTRPTRFMSTGAHQVPQVRDLQGPQALVHQGPVR